MTDHRCFDCDSPLDRDEVTWVRLGGELVPCCEDCADAAWPDLFDTREELEETYNVH
jgi:hypothetical protein